MLSERLLKDGRTLCIRNAMGQDAEAVLAFVHRVASESDFLTFGPGEFELTLAQERAFLDSLLVRSNEVYLLGLIDPELVATISFAGGSRPRVRHVGEFGMSVRQQDWGCGIGRMMLETLIAWARSGDVVKKINLRVRTDNARAIALYESLGFSRECTLRGAIRIHETYFDNHLMTLWV